MINEIIDGISIKLNSDFPNAKIYSDKIEQGLEKPCFFIGVLAPTETPLPSKRYLDENSFDIHYFAEDEGNKTGLYTAAESLFDTFETIVLTDETVMRGTKMHYEVIDDILHFFVNFDAVLLKPTAQDVMEDVTITTTVQKG